MQALSDILASHRNSPKHSKQFSDELVRSLLEAVDALTTVTTLDKIASVYFHLKNILIF